MAVSKLSDSSPDPQTANRICSFALDLKEASRFALLYYTVVLFLVNSLGNNELNSANSAKGVYEMSYQGPNFE